jgi:hypothetical protein
MRLNKSRIWVYAKDITAINRIKKDNKLIITNAIKQPTILYGFNNLFYFIYYNLIYKLFNKVVI